MLEQARELAARGHFMIETMLAAARDPHRLRYRLLPPDVMQYRPPLGPVQTTPLPQGQDPTLGTYRRGPIAGVAERELLRGLFCGAKRGIGSSRNHS
jgi:hypothetical protein